MMAKILPIGSVVKVENTKLMVVGHFSKEIENKNQYYYLTVPYPVGFVGMDKTIYIAVDSDSFEVVHEATQVANGEEYTTQLSKLSQLSPNEIAFYSRLALEAMKTTKGGN